MKNKLEKIYIELLLVLFASLILFVNSSYSPIRDLSYLNHDSMLFYIIGKGIKYGLVPYKDLIDHKGIYIFLVNYLGALISECNHIGIFIIQLIISYFNIIVIHKITSLFTKDEKVRFLSTFSVFVIQNTNYFCSGAMKCEGFLSPFIFLSIYLFLKYLLSEDINYNYKSIFINGICAGIVLFTKANLLLYFVPVIIVLFIKSRFNIYLIFKYFLYGFLGLIIGSAPAVLYGIFNNCLKEMMYYTFNVNFLYSSHLYFVYSNYLEAIIDVIFEFKEILILSLLSIYLVYRTKKIIISYYLMLILSSVAVVLVALRPYSHYANTLALNLLPVFLIVYTFIFDNLKKERIIQKTVLCVSLVIIFCVSYQFSWMATEIDNSRRHIITKEFERIVSSEEKYDGDKSTLVIGDVIAIYNELNITPSIKFFGTPYMEKRVFSEPYDEILESIEKKENNWLVLSFTPIMKETGFDIEVRKALKDKYELVIEDIFIGNEIYRKIKSDL